MIWRCVHESTVYHSTLAISEVRLLHAAIRSRLSTRVIMTDLLQTSKERFGDQLSQRCGFSLFLDESGACFWSGV